MSTETTTATYRTGAVCAESGPYQSSRNARIIVFVKRRERFPADADGAATTWTKVR
jgi:hypothetical protein